MIAKNIEAALASRRLTTGGIAMFDLSSYWMEGRCCDLAAFGYSRDKKRSVKQIEYGLLTDPQGRPVAIRVFPGNTFDTKRSSTPSAWWPRTSGSGTSPWSATVV